MGRKVHPVGFRLKINKTWDSRWYAEDDNYVDRLHQDIAVRELIRKMAPRAGVSRIEIERFPGNVKMFVHTSKPGVLIGRKGENVKLLRKELQALVGKQIDLEIKEIKDPDLDAYLVAQNIADQLVRRIAYRRAMRRGLQQVMRAGAEGAKIIVGGRLGGADMARSVMMREGRVPLHTLRADIDFAVAEAVTTYSSVGVKVWIYKGEILPESESEPEATEGVYVSE
ncbi:MAG: 30S ribosomal protein S3 [Chloroflexi bacterium]|nr:MAG: 30S ribosomal protein S3 [Chloroflexota bacterium]MBL1196651.1 30S ribosomal protein S3 [Chloroflexota bacterium]NOH13944.1 30S ribosomal protein S3 [Chloroflexota bacterium]